jgi:ADP-dependent NAD(P)H-hydrate dehydratase / NAD(P)H-hydrate epimerase
MEESLTCSGVVWTKVVNAEQMRAIDRRTIETAGITGAELMRRAGQKVFESIAGRWEDLAALDVVVVCGKGNNGGDGYVVALLLRQAGAGVRVFLAATIDEVDGDARYHLDAWIAVGGEIEPASGPQGVVALRGALAGSDLAVDALLGTGGQGEPRGGVEAAIVELGDSKVPVVAIDLPSGVDADSGKAAATCVKAAWTVTFGLPKPGHFFFPGRQLCGGLELVDIGFPAEVVEASPAVADLLETAKVAAFMPKRGGDAHKGSCGSVGVVAGSQGMSGAAALAAEAALRAGAGKVIAGVPASLHDILETKLSEVMTLALPEVGKRRCLALRAMGDIRSLAATSTSLVLGPGLGRYRETGELVRRLLPRLEIPTVVDADAINALSGHLGILRQVQTAMVLTPHLGEFARLTGIEKKEIAADPLAAARSFVDEYGVILVLKGAPTLVGIPGRPLLINPTGNAGMATAGAGDVLAGLIAGLLAQGVEAAEAACLGVFVHGVAGDRARERLGEWGMLAGDICAELPHALVDTVQHKTRST